jgi:SAM-dependent methyltransferase
MKSVQTLLRQAEHTALKKVTLSGSVLDLGGEKGAEYLKHIQGSFTVTALNLDEEARPDVVHDLEYPLPFKDGEYDHVLLVNVLEHVFEYRQLLAEAVRVLRPGGSIIIIVPFLFPVHPSPQDYRRFTDMALRKELELLKVSNIRVEPLGSGVFSANYVAMDRLLPGPLRVLRQVVLKPLVVLCDKGFSAVAGTLGKKYKTSDYALGYLVEAKKTHG